MSATPDIAEIGRIGADIQRLPRRWNRFLTRACETAKPTALAQDVMAMNIDAYRTEYTRLGFTISAPDIFDLLARYALQWSHWRRWNTRRLQEMYFIDGDEEREWDTAIRVLKPKRAPRIAGMCGSGKTTLMRFFNQRLKWRFMDAYDLTYFLAENGEAYYRTFDIEYQNRDIILDDVGNEKDANHYGSTLGLDEILLLRYRHFTRFGAMTAITTNLTRDVWAKRYGERVDSRLAEMCFPVLWSAQDFRRKQQ